MKAPRCPHCKKSLPGMQWRGLNEGALQAVIKLAKNPTSMWALASRYTAMVFEYCGDNISDRSARRAVERMCTAGILRRVSPGIYQVAKY